MTGGLPSRRLTGDTDVRAPRQSGVFKEQNNKSEFSFLCHVLMTLLFAFPTHWLCVSVLS